MPAGSPEGTSCPPSPSAAPFPPCRVPTAALQGRSAIGEGAWEGTCWHLLTFLCKTHLQLPLEALLGLARRRSTQQHPHTKPTACCLNFTLIPLSQKQGIPSPVASLVNGEELEVPSQRARQEHFASRAPFSKGLFSHHVGLASVQSELPHTPGKVEQITNHNREQQFWLNLNYVAHLAW